GRAARARTWCGAPRRRAPKGSASWRCSARVGARRAAWSTIASSSRRMRLLASRSCSWLSSTSSATSSRRLSNCDLVGGQARARHRRRPRDRAGDRAAARPGGRKRGGRVPQPAGGGRRDDQGGRGRSRAVAGGGVATGTAKQRYGREKGKGKRDIERTIPLGRVASAEDVAGPIVFLCSELARHVTGEILNVNGGSVLCG